jgi:hypothetical protein
MELKLQDEESLRTLQPNQSLASKKIRGKWMETLSNESYNKPLETRTVPAHFDL